jgi:hypothetical protein
MTETLRLIKISTEHKLAQVLDFRKLIHDVASLKAQTGHIIYYTVCNADAQGPKIVRA